MTKAILISIRPDWVAHILNGDKILELRKNVPKDFVGWVYIYVTKAGGSLINVNEFTGTNKKYTVIRYRNYGGYLNGVVVARFWFDEYYFLTDYSFYDRKEYIGYAWHIKRLQIFDEPKPLSAFKKPYGDNVTIKSPPQSWQYVCEKE